ncbi:HTH_38 domain-containing protein [Trichonephila clavipes]|nr:HTH_38 domain-containing protein [Trichonephila clavipes]
MRQANQQFSSILTKIGNGERLDEIEISLIESRFYSVEEAATMCPQVIPRRKQRSAFDQVSEFDRGRIVAYRGCGLSFKEIGRRVGRNQTTVMRDCDRWMQEGTTDRRD